MPRWGILFPELEIVKRKFICLMKFIATFEERLLGENRTRLDRILSKIIRILDRKRDSYQFP